MFEPNLPEVIETQIDEASQDQGEEAAQADTDSGSPPWAQRRQRQQLQSCAALSASPIHPVTQAAESALELEVLQGSARQAPSSAPVAEWAVSGERPSGQAPSLEEVLPSIPDVPVSQDSNSPTQEAPELTSGV